MNRRGRPVLSPVAALGVALLLLTGLAPGAIRPVRALEPPEVTGATTMTVQPEKRRVHARVDLRITNRQPDTVAGDVHTRWSVDRWQIYVPDEATDVRVTQGGARLQTTILERDGYDQVEFRLRPAVAYGKTAAVRIAYDLPDGGARSKSPIRVGRAYVSFYAFAHGDDQATLRIEVPQGFEVETRGGDIRQSATEDGGTVLTTNGSVDDLRWYVFVDGTRSDALKEETLTVQIGGEPRFLEVRSWPEDDLWASRVRDRLTSGLTALYQLDGLDWPVIGPLRVTESATRSLNGYAGFYDPGASGVLDEIRISEEPDDAVIVHEAAHAWFNDGLLTGRWISEGLAEAYAARALRRLGASAPAPDPVHRDTPVAFALNLWSAPGRIDDAAAQAKEAYAYDAARLVFDRLIDEIGEQRMRDVLADAASQAIAFQGTPKRETQTLIADFRDWRYLLDLLEQVGGSTHAEDLFRTWVVSNVELPLLNDHEVAVGRYAKLVARADGWQPAYALRAQMARWAFDYVDREIGLANEALDRRARIEPLEAAMGLDDGGALRSAFEGAVVSYDNVVSLGDDELETLDQLGAARAAVSAEHDPLQVIGLLGSDTTTDLAEAAAAYRVGHLADARSDAQAAIARIAGAADIDGQRAAAAGGVLLVVVTVGIGVGLVTRRRRRASDPALASASASAVSRAPDDGGSSAGALEPPATLAAPAGPATRDESDQAEPGEGEEGT